MVGRYRRISCGYLKLALVFLCADAARAEMNCWAYFPSSFQLRHTAVAEPIGDVSVVCTGGDSGVTHDVTVRVTLSVPLTSANPTGSKSDVILFVGVTERAAIAPGQNAFVGEFEAPTAGATWPHTVRFNGVRITEPGGSPQLVLRISNLRANLSELPYGTPWRAPVIATIDTSPRLPGFPQKFLAGYLEGPPFVTTSTPDESTGYQMQVQVREGGTEDFRPRMMAGQDSFAIGASTYAESAWITTAFQPLGVASTGMADSGTRILLRFSNVSAGQQVFVSTRALAVGTSPDARLTKTNDEGGGGAYSEVAASSATPSPGIAPVAVTNGRGLAVYEIVQANPAAMETATFGIVLQGGTGTPAVEVLYGPLAATTQTWIPRFAPPRVAPPAVVATGVFRDVLNQVRVAEYGNPQLYNAGGVFGGNPGAAQDRDGNTWIVARDSAKGLWATRFVAATKTFDSWTFLGGVTSSDPSVAVTDDGDVYYTIRDEWSNCWLGIFRRGVGNTWQHLGGVFGTDPQISWGSQGYAAITGKDAWGGIWTRTVSHWLAPVKYDSPWVYRGGIVQGQISVSQQGLYTVVGARDSGNGLWFGRFAPPIGFDWIAGQGRIDRGPRMAGPVAVGAVSDSVWVRQLDTVAGTPMAWTATGGVLKTEGAGWFLNGQQYEWYVLGRDAGNSLWWYRSSTGQWTNVGHTGVAASEIAVVPNSN